MCINNCIRHISCMACRDSTDSRHTTSVQQLFHGLLSNCKTFMRVVCFTQTLVIPHLHSSATTRGLRATAGWILTKWGTRVDAPRKYSINNIVIFWLFILVWSKCVKYFGSSWNICLMDDAPIKAAVRQICFYWNNYLIALYLNSNGFYSVFVSHPGTSSSSC